MNLGKFVKPLTRLVRPVFYKNLMLRTYSNKAILNQQVYRFCSNNNNKNDPSNEEGKDNRRKEDTQKL